MAKRPLGDVVVLLPGILGSVLARDGEESELLVTARTTGGQITETIDHFAEINNMEDCAVPLDVG